MESNVTTTKTRREVELIWIERNKKTLDQLRGKWLAIEGEELIASSFDILLVVKEAKRCGITIPFLVYVPEETQQNSMGLVS